jgi:AraC family transcriptional regulator of adaptative response / DNA-3-methyladenine glycosylase II
VILRPTEQPYRADALLAFLAARAVPGVEEVLEDGTYRRSLPDGRILELRAHPEGMEASHAVPELLDLDAPVGAIAERLGALYVPGTRIPGCVSAEEIAVRAVLGQQITVRAARTHAGRLVAAVGEPLEAPSGRVTHRFPTLEAIAGAPDDVFAMPASRRETLRRLAGQPLDRLIELKGIGPWTQTYVNMRAFKDRDAWLPTDIGVRHGLARHGAADPDAWRPYRSYAVLSLWTN